MVWGQTVTSVKECCGGSVRDEDDPSDESGGTWGDARECGVVGKGSCRESCRVKWTSDWPDLECCRIIEVPLTLRGRTGQTSGPEDMLDRIRSWVLCQRFTYWLTCFCITPYNDSIPHTPKESVLTSINPILLGPLPNDYFRPTFPTLPNFVPPRVSCTNYGCKKYLYRRRRLCSWSSMFLRYDPLTTLVFTVEEYLLSINVKGHETPSTSKTTFILIRMWIKMSKRKIRITRQDPGLFLRHCVSLLIKGYRDFSQTDSIVLFACNFWFVLREVLTCSP